MKKSLIAAALLLGASLYTVRRNASKPQSVPSQVIVDCPSGTVGIAYSCQVQVIGGTPPFTYSIGSGQLPPGLMLDPNTGIISGTPTTVWPPPGPAAPGNLGVTILPAPI